VLQRLGGDGEVGDPDGQLMGDDDHVAATGAGPGIRHRRTHAGDDLGIRLAPARDGRMQEVVPVERVRHGELHPLALEDVGGLDHAVIDDGLDSEELDEGLRGLARALQRRAHQGSDRTLQALHILGGLPRHPSSVHAQPELGESPVEHAVGVVDLPMAHEMEAIGGHRSSLRRLDLWAA